MNRVHDNVHDDMIMYVIMHDQHTHFAYPGQCEGFDKEICDEVRRLFESSNSRKRNIFIMRKYIC